MKEEYDFSQARRNPYAKKLKKQITIKLDSDTVDYFKMQSTLLGIPYQTLINLYLNIHRVYPLVRATVAVRQTAQEVFVDMSSYPVSSGTL
jgi:hypothetical protein